MSRFLGILTVTALMAGASVASAQEPAAAGATMQHPSGAVRWEISAFPGGGLLFTEGNDGAEPDFGNYALGGSVTFNLNRFVGFEGEIGGGIGIEQRLEFSDGRSVGDTTPPDLLAYQGNVVVYPAGGDRSIVPYVTGGVGGLTLFSEESLGVNDDETFLTGNVGGGVKWSFGRWGVRGDYRLVAIDAKEEASSFFGRADTRYGHRVYGGLVLSLTR